MEAIYNYLTTHPAVFFIAVIVSLMIVMASFRKLFELALFLLALFVLYAAFIAITGGEVPAILKNGTLLSEWFHHLKTLFGKVIDMFNRTPKKELFFF